MMIFLLLIEYYDEGLTFQGGTCGKPNCACAGPGHPGHGPQWNLTRKAEGRTRTVHLRPGPELEKARREVAEHEPFRDLVRQLTEVNAAICSARPVLPGGAAGGAPSAAGGEKGGSGTRSRRSGPPRWPGWPRKPPGPWAAAMPVWKPPSG